MSNINSLFLKKMMDQEKIFHAFLIESNSPKENAYYAKYLAYLIQSQSFIEYQEYLQKTLQFSPVDLIEINKHNQHVKGEHVAILMDRFWTSSMSGNIKVAIIHSFELATAKAANSILKFLENPPQKTYIILTTTNSAKILPTVISRVQELKIHDLTENQPQEYDFFRKYQEYKNLSDQEIALRIDKWFEIFKIFNLRNPLVNEIINIVTEIGNLLSILIVERFLNDIKEFSVQHEITFKKHIQTIKKYADSHFKIINALKEIQELKKTYILLKTNKFIGYRLSRILETNLG